MHEWRNLQFNVDSERQISEKFYAVNLFTLGVFARYLLIINRRRNIFLSQISQHTTYQTTATQPPRVSDTSNCKFCYHKEEELKHLIINCNRDLEHKNQRLLYAFILHEQYLLVHTLKQLCNIPLKHTLRNSCTTNQPCQQRERPFRTWSQFYYII